MEFRRLPLGFVRIQMDGDVHLNLAAIRKVKRFSDGGIAVTYTDGAEEYLNGEAATAVIAAVYGTEMDTPAPPHTR